MQIIAVRTALCHDLNTLNPRVDTLTSGLDELLERVVKPPEEPIEIAYGREMDSSTRETFEVSYSGIGAEGCFEATVTIQYELEKNKEGVLHMRLLKASGEVTRVNPGFKCIGIEYKCAQNAYMKDYREITDSTTEARFNKEPNWEWIKVIYEASICGCNATFYFVHEGCKIHKLEIAINNSSKSYTNEKGIHHPDPTFSGINWAEVINSRTGDFYR